MIHITEDDKGNRVVVDPMAELGMSGKARTPSSPKLKKPDYIAKLHEVDDDPRWGEATEGHEIITEGQSDREEKYQWAALSGHWHGNARVFLASAIGAEEALAERDAEIERLETTNGDLRNQIARLQRGFSKLGVSLADKRSGR